MIDTRRPACAPDSATLRWLTWRGMQVPSKYVSHDPLRTNSSITTRNRSSGFARDDGSEDSLLDDAAAVCTSARVPAPAPEETHALARLIVMIAGRRRKELVFRRANGPRSVYHSGCGPAYADMPERRQGAFVSCNLDSALA